MVGTMCLSRTAAIVLLSWSPTTLTSQGTWIPEIATGGPSGRFGHAAAYDMNHGFAVVFGGFDTNYVPNSETWTFDGLAWQQVNTTPMPPVRAEHAMAYDFARGRVVLFGGINSGFFSVGMHDTWEFDGNQWTQLMPLHTPTGRFDMAMTFDPNSGYVLIQGGRFLPSTLLGDTWGWNGTDWVQLATTGPSPRYRHAMCCDFLRQRTVLFGGHDTTDRDDTWEWDGTQWTVPATGGPSPRSGHAMAFDLDRGVSVLYGGLQGGNETWEWDGVAWRSANNTATQRRLHSMVFDVRRRQMTLLGGLQSTAFAVLTDAMNFAVPLPGVFTPLGSGCPGTAGAARLRAATSSASGPMLGSAAIVEVSPVAGPTFFLFGFSEMHDGATPLPYDLTPLGMTGCTLQVSRDAVTSAPAQDGVASLAIWVPDDPFLISTSFFLQAFPVDPMANAVGMTSTNTLYACVGRN